MRAAFIAFALACAAASPAAAERFALHYSASALGFVPIGDMEIDADLSEDTYQIDTQIQSGGLMSLFERTNLHGTATGAIANGAVHWQTYDLDHHYSKKHRVIAMRVGADGAVTQAIAPDYRLWGTPPTSDAQRRESRDPLSTVMAMAIDVNGSHRCAGDYPTYDGRWHYLLRLSGGHVARYDGGGYDGPVLKCDLSYIAVAGFERTDRGRMRVPHGEVWFALIPDSAFGPPVHISTPLSAGGATIRLTQMRRVAVGVVDAPDEITVPNANAPQAPTP